MNGIKKRQKGSSAVSLLFNLLVIGVSFSFAAKVVPFYLDDHSVRKIVSSLSQRSGYETASMAEVRAWINEDLESNGLKLDQDDIRTGRKYGVVVVKIDYERRINFFSNIDLVLTFEHNWKAGTQ